MDSPEGTIKSLPEQKVEEWVEHKVDPFLKQFDKKVVENKEWDLMERKYKMFKWLVIIIAVLAAGFILLAYNENFKSNIDAGCNITIPSCPIIPACPSLDCPAIPSCNPTLNCGNVTFPSKLNINLTNQS